MDRCPLCKIEFNKSDLQSNKKIEKEIKESWHVCKCGAQINLDEWNDHTAKCQKYLDIISTNIKQSVVKDFKPTVNRSTFNCTCCSEKNLDREGLLKHVSNKHKNSQAVCPICLCQPWGDPNYVTHLHGHLQKRHKFDYDTTVEYNEEEDEVLKKVLLESMKYK